MAALELRRFRFARARPEAFEISSDRREISNRLPEYMQWKQIINVKNVYQTSVHFVTESKANTKNITVDPKHAKINHYRIPSNEISYDKFNFDDPGAKLTDAALLKEIPLLEAAIATRFKIQASAVQSFLKNLAFRRPPNVTMAAAQHKMR